MSQHFHSYGELKGIEKRASHKYLFTIVHSDVIPNREQLGKAKYLSTGEFINKCGIYTPWNVKCWCTPHTAEP